MIRGIPSFPRRVHALLVYCLENWQTTWVEFFASGVTAAYGIAVAVRVSPTLQQLLGSIPTKAVGLTFGLVGIAWFVLIIRALLTKHVRACKRAAGAGFVCWLYLCFDIFAVAGGSTIWVLLTIFYSAFMLMAGVCYLRCDVVADSPPREEGALA